MATLQELLKAKKALDSSSIDPDDLYSVADKADTDKLAFGKELSAADIDKVNSNPKLTEQFVESLKKPSIVEPTTEGVFDYSPPEKLSNQELLDKFKFNKNKQLPAIRQATEISEVGPLVDHIPAVDPTKIRLQNALKNTQVVGESYIPKSNFEKIVENLEPAIQSNSKIPDISSKLADLETNSVKSVRDRVLSNLQKSSDTPVGALSSLDDTERLSKIQPVLDDLNNVNYSILDRFDGSAKEAVKKILNSRAAAVAGKGLGVLGAGMEAKNMADNLGKGENIAATGNAAGMASGVAAAMGAAPASAALAATQLGIAGGNEQGKQMAEYGVDEMGNSFTAAPKSPNDFTGSGVPLSPEMLGLPMNPNSSPFTKQPKPSASIADLQSDQPIPQDVGIGANKQRSSVSMSGNVGSGRMPADEQSSLEPQGFTNNTVAALKEAQEQANRGQLLANLLRASNTFGTGIAGAISGAGPTKDISKDSVDALEKQAQNPVIQLKEQQEKERDDPGSRASVQSVSMARDMLKQAGLNPKVVEGMSYNDIEKRFPMIGQMINSKENRESREGMFKLKREELAQNKESVFDNREKLLAARALTQGARQIQTAGGVRGNQLRARLDQANNIFATMGVNPNYTAEDVSAMNVKDLDKNNRLQIVEAAVELNKLLSGSGVPAQATLNKLIPSNIKMEVKNVQDYMTNKLNPREQGEFVRDVLKITARARDYAKGENTKLSQGVVSSLPLVKKHYPDEYQQFLDSNSLIDTGDYLKNRDKAQKTVVKKGYNSKTDETQLIYSNGEKEIVKGRR